jgi:hypothetical protein
MYYFIVTRDNFFFFCINIFIYYEVHTDNNYSERVAFDLIDHIYSNDILNMMSENGSLTDEGQQSLKEIFMNYEDHNNLLNVSGFLDNNKNKDEGVDEIDIKIEDNFIQDREQSNSSRKLKNESKNPPEVFSDEEKRKNLLWRNIKLYSILICIGICIVLYIILPIFVESTGGLLGSHLSNNTQFNESQTVYKK